MHIHFDSTYCITNEGLAAFFVVVLAITLIIAVRLFQLWREAVNGFTAISGPVCCAICLRSERLTPVCRCCRKGI